MPQDTCTLEGCENRRKYRLYCGLHYKRAQANGGDPGPATPLVMPRDGSCSVDGCDRPIRSRGLCEPHYGRFLRRGTTERVVYETKPCSVEACSREAHTRGMCRLHYGRWLKHGTTELQERLLNRDLPCSVDGCDSLRRALTYCEAHYKRFRVYGDAAAPTPERPARPIEDVFWEHVTAGAPEECWPWQGTISTNGYGVFNVKGRQHKAHRIACAIGMGRSMDPNAMACHRCNNPVCVNPGHLYEGDPMSNSHDMVEAGNSLRGRKNHKNILTADEVREIRKLRGSRSTRSVSEQFGVSQSAIANIWHRRTWKWLG